MTPLEMMQLSQGLSDLYVGLETDLIANIAEYLARGDLHSSTAQWKIRMLAQLGALDRMNLQTIAAYAGLAPDLLDGILEAAALAAIEELEPGFQSLVREEIIHNTPTSVERTMERALKAYNKQAANSLNMVNTVMQYKAKAAARKIINDTAELENKQTFLDMLNKAAGKAVTGAESRQAAMRQCIKEMTEKGIPAFVDRAGREWSPEAYINMDIRTTAANTTHQAQFDRMDDYGLHLHSVSSHAGARPKCAKDQGKIFNRSGGGGYTEDLHGRKIRYYAWKDSSYGEPDGLLGINCGHQVYPFVPGLDVQRYFPYDEEENAELYEKTQQQRELERRVRRSKRECMALETVGDEDGLHKASATLKQRQQALRQYCEDNGLSYKPDRTAVVGYNRSVEAKVRKSLTSGAKSGKMNMKRAKSRSRKGIKAISNEHFNNLTIEARKNGALILRGGEEVEKHLDNMQADAAIIGDVIMFREHVCVSEVLEETHHFMQNLQGMNDDKGEPLRTFLNEIDAKQYLLDNAQKFGIPRSETELTTEQLKYYKEQLAKLTGGGTV